MDDSRVTGGTFHPRSTSCSHQVLVSTFDGSPGEAASRRAAGSLAGERGFQRRENTPPKDRRVVKGLSKTGHNVRCKGGGGTFRKRRAGLCAEA